MESHLNQTPIRLAVNATKEHIEPSSQSPISSHNLKTVYPNSSNTPEHLGYPRIYHHLHLHRDPDLDNNPRAAVAGSTWAAADMARRKGQAVHKVLVDNLAGRDLGSRSTGSVEGSLDSLALAGLPDLHRNGKQVVDSRAAGLQALSTSTVSNHECVTGCLGRAYVLVRHCGVDWRTAVGRSGWRCGVEASILRPLMRDSPLCLEILMPIDSIDWCAWLWTERQMRLFREEGMKMGGGLRLQGSASSAPRGAVLVGSMYTKANT